ncbi:NADH-quinone oxidoreductase subunit J [Buchnera aphidicola]|uniref:NADH-quinone oxidoreductase subunit J n=1 Tax=Buchnera aphidicola subsp. Cinara cedri (strain Cc) TaxID=372461 RepID=Q057W7_BUCCC|nr:NADH-quinone oxidoreductase subunit J [Buchnera aphidicola]ABJ90582.1 NADH dehydrogenase I chain J [Buchnera aphidicola BCc]
MAISFWLFSFLAVFFSILIMISINLIYSLIYLILLIFSIASIFCVLGLSFIGVLEVIIYAGAITVLFILIAILMRPKRFSRNFFFNNLKNFFYFSSLFFTILIFFIFFIQINSNKDKFFFYKKFLIQDICLCLFNKYLFLIEFSSLLLLSSVLLVCFFLRK